MRAQYFPRYRARDWEFTMARTTGAESTEACVPDEVLGERACAVVVPRPEAAVTLEEIVAYLREEGIATFKLPERLEIRDELPRNPLGKILGPLNALSPIFGARTIDLCNPTDPICGEGDLDNRAAHHQYVPGMTDQAAAFVAGLV